MRKHTLDAFGNGREDTVERRLVTKEIGIRNLADLAAMREVHQQMKAIVHGLRTAVAQRIEVVAVHRKDQIERREVRLDNFARAQIPDVDAVFFSDENRTRIRRRTFARTVEARRIQRDFTDLLATGICARKRIAADSFRKRRAANIAQADKK